MNFFYKILGLVLLIVVAGGFTALGQEAANNNLPRYASIGSNKVNVRRGPSEEYPVKWQYRKRHYPVQILAESEDWRFIKDPDGSEGWVYKSLISPKRTILVVGDGGGRPVAFRADADGEARILALLEPGVIGTFDICSGIWCRVVVQGIDHSYDGWLHRSLLWGVDGRQTPPLSSVDQIINDNATR